MLRVGLNLLYLIPDELKGVETFARCLMVELAEQGRDIEFHVFLSSSAQSLETPQGANVHKVIVPVDNRSRYKRYLWEQLLLPVQTWKRGLHVLHSLSYVSPLWGREKRVVTIHDANYYDIGSTMGFYRRFGLGSISKLSARTSDAVATVSNFSKGQLCQRLNLPEAKIRVIHSGCGWSTPPSTEVAVDDMRLAYNLQNPYIVAFGGGYPHKNIGSLYQAFEMLAATIPHDLVIIGNTSKDVTVEQVAGDVRSRIRLLGHVPTADVGHILGGADLLVFPSLYEGFGFPILEAQRHSTAVVCSRAAALPEVAGNGAEFFDPTSVADISSKINMVLKDERLRQRLILAGNQNVERFSWRHAALEYIDLYRSLGENTGYKKSA